MSAEERFRAPLAEFIGQVIDTTAREIRDQIPLGVRRDLAEEIALALQRERGIA